MAGSQRTAASKVALGVTLVYLQRYYALDAHRHTQVVCGRPVQLGVEVVA
jgi:hypothetical protein